MKYGIRSRGLRARIAEQVIVNFGDDVVPWVACAVPFRMLFLVLTVSLAVANSTVMTVAKGPYWQHPPD